LSYSTLPVSFGAGIVSGKLFEKLFKVHGGQQNETNITSILDIFDFGRVRSMHPDNIAAMENAAMERILPTLEEIKTLIFNEQKKEILTVKQTLFFFVKRFPVSTYLGIILIILIYKLKQSHTSFWQRLKAKFGRSRFKTQNKIFCQKIENILLYFLHNVEYFFILYYLINNFKIILKILDQYSDNYEI
jgi:hypothetical protein